ncbi:MAG: ABC transporter substrate-binding protein [Actinobacteria bacterium]|nr:ABC transporter substrate-binding protein [Actinomycetota bacterium]
MTEWENKSTRRQFVAGAGAAFGAVALGGFASACGSSTPSGAGTTGAAGTSRGGALRVAVSGGGQRETLNPILSIYDNASQLRTLQVFEWIAEADRNAAPKLQLAESIEPNKDGSQWTVRFRSGLKWHDGKPVTSQDLRYTLEYVGNPKTGASQYPVTALMDLGAMKKLDERTLLIPMKQPIGDLMSLLIGPGWGLIQDGTTKFVPAIGTGPFKFKSWTRGQNSAFVKNADYWQSGLPYVDSLECLSIDDETARLNALLSGQVDAVGGLPFPRAKSYQSQGESSPIKLLVGDASQATSITMGMSHPPFEDPRVRKAMRLIVSRAQMVADAQYGFGHVANDIPCLGVPYYDTELEQREQDLEQAKSLLKAAGQDRASFTLNSTNGNFFPGQLASATLFAQQAAQIGLKINVENLPAESYYVQGFPNEAFAQIQWTPATIPSQYLLEYLPDAPLNGCQWKDPRTTKMIHEALAAVNKSQAEAKWKEVQRYMWENGPEIFWGTCPNVDAVASNVVAYASKFGPLDWYDFRRWEVT